MIDILLAYWAEMPDALKLFVTITGVCALGCLIIDITISVIFGRDDDVMGHLWAIIMTLATLVAGAASIFWALTH